MFPVCRFVYFVNTINPVRRRVLHLSQLQIPLQSRNIFFSLHLIFWKRPLRYSNEGIKQLFWSARSCHIFPQQVNNLLTDNTHEQITWMFRKCRASGDLMKGTYKWFWLNMNCTAIMQNKVYSLFTIAHSHKFRFNTPLFHRINTRYPSNLTASFAK